MIKTGVDAIKNSAELDIVYSDHSIKLQKCIEIIGALNYFILLLSCCVGQKTNNKKADKKQKCILFLSIMFNTRYLHKFYL